MMVATTAPTALVLPRIPTNGLDQWLNMAIVAMALVGIWLFAELPRHRRWGQVSIIAVVALFLGLSGCNGSSSSPHVPNPGTPTGTYSVMITATSGSLTHSTFFSLTVQ
jgi:hypothetical protein